jgi:transcriptional regulator with XRE-family HTH domain
MNLKLPFSQRRRALGLTQTELAHLSGVSLPTIQNLEKGRGNPSLSILEPIGRVLGIDLRFEIHKTDWSQLIAAGVPLMGQENVSHGQINLENMLCELRLACVEVFENAQIDPRNKEALSAFLIAIKSHYPAFYKKKLARCPAARELTSVEVTGRMIELKRLALARVSEIL